MSCPVGGCQYLFAADLEDVAVDRHRQAHAAAEWDEVRERLETRRANLVKDHEEALAVYDDDLERLAKWRGDSSS